MIAWLESLPAWLGVGLCFLVMWIPALVAGAAFILSTDRRDRATTHLPLKERGHVHQPTPPIAPWFGRCYTCGEVP